MRLIDDATLAVACAAGLLACEATPENDTGSPVPVDVTTPDEDGFTPDGAWRSTGFEIIDTQPGIAWMAIDIDRAEFEALELPSGWVSNPRDLDANFGDFLMSPDETEQGTFEELDMFGYRWRHVATISDRGQPVDADGLLVSTRVDKHHRLTFEAGREMTTLTSPEGETYLRVNRAPAPPRDVPSLPEGWTLDAFTPDETTIVLLAPSITLLRADNDDSFQGPVDDPSR